MASHCTYGPEGRHGPTTRVLIYIRASHYAWAPWPDWNIRAVGSVQSNLSFRSVRKSSDSDSHLLHACLPVCPFAWNNSDPTQRIFMRFDIFRKSIDNAQLYYSLTILTGAVQQACQTCGPRTACGPLQAHLRPAQRIL